MTHVWCSAHHENPVAAEPHAQLCHGCRAGLRRDLRALPALDAALEYITAMPSASAPGGGAGALPFNAAASAQRDQLRGLLSSWAVLVVEETRPDAWPVPSVAGMAGWLLAHCGPGRRGYCAFRPWAGDMASEFATCRVAAVGVLDPFVQRRWVIRGSAGVCPVCGVGRLRAVVFVSAPDRRVSHVVCGGCGSRWDLGGPDQVVLRRLVARQAEVVVA